MNALLTVSLLASLILTIKRGLALLAPATLPAPAALSAPAVVLILLGAVAGCQDSERRDVPGGTAARAIAVVNNERINVEEFLNEHILFFTRWDRFIRNDKDKKKNIKEIILSNMIDEKLLDQEARRRGIKLSVENLEQKLRKLVAPYGDDELIPMVRSPNFSMDKWRSVLRRRLIHTELIRREVTSKIRITQRELRAYYERNRNDFVVPEQVRVRHIAVSSRSELRKVARRLRRGRDFVKLVRDYSVTPDRQNDGDLGFVPRGVLPQEFDQAIFKLRAIGSISSIERPVKTQMGFHIFRLEGRKPKVNLGFRSALPRIKKAIIQQKQSRAFQLWIQALRDRATIKIDNRLLNAEMG